MSIEAMKLALFALDIVKIHYTQNRICVEAQKFILPPHHSAQSKSLWFI